MTIPERFYRISAKALILNETRDAFLICQEESGKWELPGGGLEWGESPAEALQREVREEMGLSTTWVAPHPSYFFTFTFERHDGWGANVLFDATVEHLQFTPSEECVAIDFVNRDTVKDKQLFSTVEQLVAVFDPANHQ